MREAFINKMIRDTEAQAFAKAPSLAADLEKALPNFLFNDKETHEKLFAELQQVDDLQSLEGAVALNPKLKKILSDQKKPYYDQCIDIQVKIWSECKSISDSITTTRNCFQEKVSAPATWEVLIATITPKAATK